MKTRYKEHQKKDAPVKKHLGRCREQIEFEDDVEILDSSARGETYLKIREALWIKESRPTINVKDEYKSRTLTIKW